MRTINFKYSVITLIVLITHNYAAANNISITTTQSLSFGSFVAGGGGNIVISPLGVRTNTGTTTLLSSDPGAPAQFFVTSKAKNKRYNITFPSAINLTGPGASMRLNQFTSSPTRGNTGTNGQAFSVGGTLRVNSNQTPGSYSGSFVVTVDLD
jgi:hypothetical protein